MPGRLGSSTSEAGRHSIAEIDVHRGLYRQQTRRRVDGAETTGTPQGQAVRERRSSSKRQAEDSVGSRIRRSESPEHMKRSTRPSRLRASRR